MKSKLKNTDEIVIDAVSNVLEFRNAESKHPVKRIRKFTECLGKGVMRMYPEYGLTPAKLSVIVCVSAIHDIGKLAVPDAILLKPGKLSQKEMETVKLHTVKGAEIIHDLVHLNSKEYYKYCYEIVRHHHERYDGRGYPDGLKGEKISRGAQIVSLADAYDALISERVYKEAFSPERAFMIIMKGECGTFSRKLLNVFENVRPEMEKLARRYKE